MKAASRALTELSGRVLVGPCFWNSQRCFISKCVCVCVGVCVRERESTKQRDQYIISYKLNSTWIDPGGRVYECTLNPPDQCGGHEMGLLRGSLGAGVL